KNKIGWAFEEAAAFQRVAPREMALVGNDEIHLLSLQFAGRRLNYRDGILRRSPTVDDRSHGHRAVFRIFAPLSDHGPTDVGLVALDAQAGEVPIRRGVEPAQGCRIAD